MKGTLLSLLLLALMLGVQATTIVIENYCRQTIPLWQVNGASAGNSLNDRRAFHVRDLAGNGGYDFDDFNDFNDFLNNFIHFI